MMFKRLLTIIFLAVFLVMGFTGLTFADNYPTKPIQFIVPWSPGGGSDTLMRITAKYLDKYLGVAVVVINKPGVGGTLGLKEFSIKPNNGYYIAQIHEGLMAAHHTGITELNYDSFIPVASMTGSPQYLAVRSSAPYNTLEEFIEYAKRHPGEVKVGATLKTISHIWPAILAKLAGVEFKYVAYEGTGQRVQALAGGFIDAICVDYPSGYQFVKIGKFNFLASATPKRLEMTPDIPTMRELGYDIIWDVKRGIVFPKGTSQDKVVVLEEALRKVAHDEDYIRDIETAGGDVEFMGFEQYQSYLEKLNKAISDVAGVIK